MLSNKTKYSATATNWEYRIKLIQPSCFMQERTVFEDSNVGIFTWAHIGSSLTKYKVFCVQSDNNLWWWLQKFNRRYQRIRTYFGLQVAFSIFATEVDINKKYSVFKQQSKKIRSHQKKELLFRQIGDKTSSFFSTQILYDRI